MSNMSERARRLTAIHSVWRRLVRRLGDRQAGGARVGKRRKTGPAAIFLCATALALTMGGCGGVSAGSSGTPGTPAGARVMAEYVLGRWVAFRSTEALTPEQWSVVDAYANFSSAALAVYATRSVAALATVVSPQSHVTAMFKRDLASGTDPEALYTRAIVESVAIHGCRATLTLELYYPGGRRLHYVSSWVRPFDRSALRDPKRRRAGVGSPRAGGLTALTATQHGPWLFVGDNRVGGVETPCGI